MTDSQQFLFSNAPGAGAGHVIAGREGRNASSFCTPTQARFAQSEEAKAKYEVVLAGGSSGVARVPAIMMATGLQEKEKVGFFRRLFGGGGSTATLDYDMKSSTTAVATKPTAALAEAVKDAAVVPISSKPGRAAGLSPLYTPVVVDPNLLPKARSTKKGGLPVVGCMPGCTHHHEHDFDYDYGKNYKDALNKRPGEFAEYNWMAKNYGWLKDESRGVVCDGDGQTPINLETGLKIKEDFQDKEFDVNYAEIDPKE